MTESTDIADPISDEEATVSTQIAEFNRVEKLLASIGDDLGDVPDCSTPEGLAEAKKQKKPLQKLRTGLEKFRLDFNRDSMDAIAKVNEQAKLVHKKIAELEDPRTEAINAEAEKQKRLIAEREAEIEREKAEAAAAEQKRIDDERAELEREKAEVAAEKQRVADEAEALEKAKQDEQDRIAAEAKAEQDRKDAEAQAETDRLAEIEREKEREAERKAAAAQAEKDKAAAVEKAKADAIAEEQARQAEADRVRIAAEKAAEAKRVATEKREAKKAEARPYVEKLRAWQQSIADLPEGAPDSMGPRIEIINTMLANIADTVAESEQATEQKAA